MPTYLVDPLSFQAEGAIVDWNVTARRLGVMSPTGAAYPRTVQLRWMLRADFGLPTEPFQVWIREHTANAGFQPLTLNTKQLFNGAVSLLSWTQGSMCSVILNITAAAAGYVLAYGGSPTLDNIVAMRTIGAGASTVEITAHCINFLLLPQGVTVNSATGLGPGGYANSPGWQPAELVGLPVTAAQWAGIGKHGEPQGIAGAFTDAPTAAIARLTRGAPPFGWNPNIATGVPAPPWTAPNSTLLIQEVNTELLNNLLGIAKNVAPNQQAGAAFNVFLPPPQNAAGKHPNKPGTTTQMYPLPMTYMAAASDPFLNLALGFGTAYDLAKVPMPTTVVVRVPTYDFMITAHWAKGLDGASGPVDLAAIVSAPGAAASPATPANVTAQVLGALRPAVSDGDWSESVRLAWDRPVSQQLLRTASCAAARVSVTPAQAATPLMLARASGGFRPIVLGSVLDPPHAQDPEWWRVNVMDREIDIPANPGSRQLQYGAATQDIYGQWSPWATTNATIAQPDLEPVRLSNPRLTPAVPNMGAICATTLTVDVTWDWRVRSPQAITMVGRLFAAATHGAPPLNTMIPAGLDMALGISSAALVLTFAGDTPTSPGATITPLTEDGESVAASFGAAQGVNRRYRITHTGMLLDFGSTGFIGLALWAQGQERIAPNRLSPFTDGPAATPLVTSTADPRPPVVPVFHAKLGSLPDASGCSHAMVSWTPQPNATGYFVYEAVEASLRAAWGLPEPTPKDTLDARATLIHEHFKTNPVRRPFTRWNSTAIKTAYTDIALPRGSTDIHVYLVLGISAGQAESAWPAPSPTADNALIVVAAPHITKPAPPMIEVQSVLDNSVSPPVYRASLQVTTRPGPRPAMVELYRVRVDDAARELDTMGPPLVRLKTSTGPWNVATTIDPVYGPYVTAVKGTDAPSGSWKRVWYRATAWTQQDDTRGGLPGRSEPSNAAWVVLPPATAPTLSVPSLSTGPTAGDVVVQWTCDSPLKRTPLGPHKISVRAAIPGAATPLLTPLDTTLDALPHAAPATGSGVWIVATSAGVTTYQALLRRVSINDAVNFAVRVTDPLGRSSSRNVAIAAGPLDPPPDLGNLNYRVLPLPPPARTLVAFTSSSPLVAPPDGPYVLHVAEQAAVITFPPTPMPNLTLPLGSVPTGAPSPVPSLYIVRSVAGPPYTYTVVAAGVVKGFTVRLTAPDGKFVEKTT